MMKRERFVMSQDIFDRIRGAESIKAGIKEIAAETGYKISYIKTVYYQYRTQVLGSKKEEMAQRRKLIIERVSENPDNLQQVFREISDSLNCGVKIVEDTYYRSIKNSTPVFNIISKKSGDFNVKNNHKDKYSRKKTSFTKIKEWWNKITETFKNI